MSAGDPHAPGRLPTPDRDEVRLALAERLDDLGLRPPVAILARDILGDDARVDLVVHDGDGGVVLVLVAEPGEETASVARAAAQRAWLRPRLRDWAQLAPERGLRPELAPRCLVVGARFEPAARTAAAEWPDGIALVGVRRIRHEGRSALVFEELVAPGPVPDDANSRVETMPFRSGLHAEDLGLTDDERRELTAPLASDPPRGDEFRPR